MSAPGRRSSTSSTIRRPLSGSPRKPGPASSPTRASTTRRSSTSAASPRRPTARTSTPASPLRGSRGSSTTGTPSKVTGAPDLFEEHECVTLSSNVKNLVRTSQGEVWCGCKDGTIHVLDVDGQLCTRVEGPTYAASKGPVKVDVTSITLIGEHVWTGSTEGLIRLWDATTYELRRELQGHTSSVTVIAAEPEDQASAASQRLVFSGAHDWTIRMWNAAGGFVRQLLGHSSWLRSLLFEPNTRYLWSGGDEGTIRRWDTSDLNRSEAVDVITAHQKGVMSMALVGEEQHIWTGGGDGIIKVWDTEGRPLTLFQAHKGWVHCMLPVADMVWTGSPDRTLRIWNTSGKMLKSLDMGAYVLNLHRWKQRIWLTTGDKNVRILQIKSEKLLQRIRHFEKTLEDQVRQRHDEAAEAARRHAEEAQRLQYEEMSSRQQQDIDRLTRQLSQCKGERRTYEQQIQELESLIVSLKAEIAHLEARLEEEEQRNEDLAFQLSQAAVPTASLDFLSDDSESHALELNQRIADLEAQLRQASQALRQREAQAEQIPELKSVLLSLEEKLEATRHETAQSIQDYEETVARLHRELKEARRTESDAQQRWDENEQHMERELDDCRQSQRSLRDENEQLQQQITDLLSSHRPQSELDSLQVHVDELTQQLNDTQQQIEAQNEEKEQMTARVMALETSLSEQEAVMAAESTQARENESQRLAEKDDQLRSLTTSSEDLQAQVRQWEDRYQTLSEEKAHADARLLEATQAQKKQEERTHVLESERDNLAAQLEQEIANAAAHAQHQEEANASRAEELARRNQELEQTLAQREEGQRTTQSEFEALQQRVEQQALDLQALQEKLQDAEALNQQFAEEQEQQEGAYMLQMEEALQETRQSIAQQYKEEQERLESLLQAQKENAKLELDSLQREHETRLRQERLQLDDSYRDSLEEARRTVDQYRRKLALVSANYRNVSLWMLSGMDDVQEGQEPHLIKTGFMLKRGDRVKNWKRRLFVLREDGCVAYYANKDCPRPRGTINLSDLTEVKHSAGTADMPDSLDLHTKGRIWSLHYDQANAQQEWMDLINNFYKRHSLRYSAGSQ